MDPLLAFIIQQIIIQAPALAIEIVQLLSKPSVTDGDWAALKAKYGGKTYEQYVTGTKPPAGN